jgi:predicted transcriptional regulator
MVKRDIDKLGGVQRQVMNILWQKTEGTVTEVRDALRRDDPPAYTTVLSVLQQLEKSGWVKHRTVGRRYVYRPMRSLDDERSRSLKSFVGRVFGGDRLLLFQQLLGDARIDDAEVKALREMIRKAQRDDD